MKLQRKLILIDDHPMVLEGLKLLLKNHTDTIVVKGSFTTGKDASIFVEKNKDIDLVFLDINLPEINGFELCKLFKKRYPSIKVIALSTHNERSMVTRMLQNGASGFLSKSAQSNELATAIETVCNGGIYLGNDIQAGLNSSQQVRPSLPSLTRREIEILVLLSEGKTAAQISEVLFLSQLTVETHKKNMMRKLEVNNTAALIKIALENGLI